MEDWETNYELLDEIEAEIEKLKVIRKAEKEKIPTEAQWAEMTEKEQREWARNATPEQLDKM
jgi:hypothetical protein